MRPHIDPTQYAKQRQEQIARAQRLRDERKGRPVPENSGDSLDELAGPIRSEMPHAQPHAQNGSAQMSSPGLDSLDRATDGTSSSWRAERQRGGGADTDGARAPAQAERSALPPGWTEHHDRTSNKAYYHHAASKTTTWERPAPGGPPVAAWPVAAAAPAPVAALPKRASYPRGSQRHKSPARQQVRPFSAGRQTLVMPALSPTMEVGTIGSWHKSEGDFVEEGDTIADIETDKATISWDHTGEEGYLSKILVQAGSEVRVGRPVAILVEEAPASTKGVAPGQASPGGPGGKTIWSSLSWFNQVTIRDGQRAIIWKPDGRAELVTGPAKKFLMGDQIEFLREYVADAIRYLVIVDKEGNTEHIPGPANVWFDPTKHRSIAVKRVIMLDSNEHIVSYLRKDGTITRRVVEGPTVHIPASNEWVHEFKWKAKSALHDDGGTFNVLKTLPDQFEVTIPRLRSLDNAEVSMNVMVFMQLVDVQKLLNSTHDPVTDLKVSITADLTEFVSKCTLDQLKERTHELNDLKMFRQSTQRADQIGYKVSKVTYRGYGFSREIDNMLKQNLVDETKLKIEKETAVKAQDIEDMKASRKVDRDLKWKEAEVTTNKLDLDIERTRADQRRAAISADAEQRRVATSAAMADEIAKLEKLEAMGVDLTQYLVSQQRKPADKEVRITNDSAEKAPILHMHVDDRSPRSPK